MPCHAYAGYLPFNACPNSRPDRSAAAALQLPRCCCRRALCFPWERCSPCPESQRHVVTTRRWRPRGLPPHWVIWSFFPALNIKPLGSAWSRWELSGVSSQTPRLKQSKEDGNQPLLLRWAFGCLTLACLQLFIFSPYLTSFPAWLWSEDLQSPGQTLTKAQFSAKTSHSPPAFTYRGMEDESCTGKTSGGPRSPGA